MGSALCPRAVLVDPVLASPFNNMHICIILCWYFYIHAVHVHVHVCMAYVYMHQCIYLSFLSIYLSFYLYLFFHCLFFYPSICLHGYYNIYIYNDYMYIYMVKRFCVFFALSCQVATHTYIYIYTYILIVYKSMSSLVSRLSLVAQDQLWHRKLIFYRRPQGLRIERMAISELIQNLWK